MLIIVPLSDSPWQGFSFCKCPFKYASLSWQGPDKWTTSSLIKQSNLVLRNCLQTKVAFLSLQRLQGVSSSICCAHITTFWMVSRQDSYFESDAWVLSDQVWLLTLVFSGNPRSLISELQLTRSSFSSEINTKIAGQSFPTYHYISSMSSQGTKHQREKLKYVYKTVHVKWTKKICFANLWCLYILYSIFHINLTVIT